MKNTGRKTVKGGSTSAPMVAKSSTNGSSAPATLAKASTPSRAAGSAPPTHEQIATRSFEIYLARGAQPGHEVDDWFQAVRELGG